MVEPDSLDRESLVSLTVDVEWAHPCVLMAVVSMLDQRGLRATFFCTHAGIDVPGHERAIHPNFRRENNSIWNAPIRRAAGRGERVYWQTVVSAFQQFCPEAIGVRSHGLFYESQLLGVYRAAGLRYDSSCFLPLTRALQPVWMPEGILELPIYYMDFWDIHEQATGFRLDAVRLEEPGLKVLCFHPNLIYANHTRIADYASSKPDYHEPGKLIEKRCNARGVRDLFQRTLDRVANGGLRCATLSEIDTIWRRSVSKA